MNPLDLHGPEFLGFYVVTLLIAVALAAIMRWLLRPPWDEALETSQELTPIEVAYLGGREDGALNAAMAGLVHRNLLEVDGVARKVKARKSLPGDANSMEMAVWNAAHTDSGDTVVQIRSSARSKAVNLRDRLLDLGLIVSPEQGLVFRCLSSLPVWGVFVLGLLKIFVGISRAKPVGFLNVLVIATVAVALFFTFKPQHRTRRGDRLLQQLKEENAALEHTAKRHPDRVEAADMVLAMGLFGTAILASGHLAQLQLAFRPPPSSSGSGCGSSGCGGGGGCGGGCGGGGCGGCGGG